MNGSLCARLREDCLPVWSSLHAHPFLTELAAGTLPTEKFRFYVEQNLMYLREYSRAIALGAARAGDLEELRSFARSLDNIVSVEIPANEARLAEVIALGAEDRGGTLEPARANLAYTNFLLATAFKGGPLEVMVAIMPCAWSYGEIAVHLGDDATDHPVYGTWLAFFASADYAVLVEGMRRELDELALRTGADEARLGEIFKTGARLELGFWEMAYSLERWPDAITNETKERA